MKAIRLTVLVVVVSVLSCSESSDQPLPTIPVDAADVGPINGDVADDGGVSSGAIVEIDLSAHLPDAQDESKVRVYQLEGEAPFSGEVIQGRPGDWVVENEVARFLIEGDNRAMSPCPWGGTVIDAAYLADGTDEDILGEICMLANGGLSFRPDRFDVLHDGTDGGPVVLAASGALVVNDFLNLPAMIDDFVEGLGDRIHLDIDTILPLRQTTYYILGPGETHLHILHAFRNDSDEQVDMLPIFPVASGGNGYYFNPMNGTGGFGAGGTSALGVGLEDLPFIVFNGERTSYAFVPEPTLDLEENALPTAGSYVVISGVAASVLGAPVHRLLQVLTATEEQLPELEELMHLDPRTTEVLEQRLYVGTAAVSSMADPIYQQWEIDTATLRGTVRDSDGEPVEGARVTAMFEGFRTRNQTISGPDGGWSMLVPPGEYEVIARRGGMAPQGPATVIADVGEAYDLDVVVSKSATIRVRVETPDDGCLASSGAQPVPARLTVVCTEDPCPNAPQMTEADVSFHRKPSDFAAVEYGTVDGVVEAEVPPGDYRIVVSRGIEWSMWPSDATETGGMAITVESGETAELGAEIARVVDTGAAYSGDFHIHSISSPDSPVPKEARVRNFLAEGVDMMVSTDHDYIADFRPTIDDLSANPWIQAIVGEEVTTADLGHFNAFPLEQDLSHPRGGAIDWGNGDDHTLLPVDLFAVMEEHPGEQVIQVNHAAGLGLIKSAQADVLRGITYANREKHRLPPAEPDPQTGDTGIWSDDFTAMELMNGNSRGRFYRLGRWWMTMIGRGFTPTGTAVTDTHKLYSDLGGVPRTYVWGTDDVSCGDRPFDGLDDYEQFVADYATSINAGRAIGTNGPFVGVTIQNGAAQTAGLSETIAADDETVASLELRLPEWMAVNAIDIYLNPDLTDIRTRPGEIIEDPIPPTQTVAVELDPQNDLVTVHTGEAEHRAWHKTIEIPIQTDEDAFLVFVVKGSQSMWPLVGTSPFAFTNPIYLDADGGGYDNPPYAAAAARPPEPGELPPCPDQFCGERQPMDDDQMTPQEVIDAVRHLDCQNPAHPH